MESHPDCKAAGVQHQTERIPDGNRRWVIGNRPDRQESWHTATGLPTRGVSRGRCCCARHRWFLELKHEMQILFYGSCFRPPVHKARKICNPFVFIKNCKYGAGPPLCALYDGGDSGSIGLSENSRALFDNRIFRTPQPCRLRRRSGIGAARGSNFGTTPRHCPFCN